MREKGKKYYKNSRHLIRPIAYMFDTARTNHMKLLNNRLLGALK